MMFFGVKVDPSDTLLGCLISLYGLSNSSASDIIIKSGFVSSVPVGKLDDNDISVLSNMLEGKKYGKVLENEVKSNMKFGLRKGLPRYVRQNQGRPSQKRRNCSTNGATARKLNRSRFK